MYVTDDISGAVRTDRFQKEIGKVVFILKALQGFARFLGFV